MVDGLVTRDCVKVTELCVVILAGQVVLHARFKHQQNLVISFTMMHLVEYLHLFGLVVLFYFYTQTVGHFACKKGLNTHSSWRIESKTIRRKVRGSKLAMYSHLLMLTW